MIRHISKNVIWLIVAVVLVAFVWSCFAVEFDFEKLWAGRQFMADYLTRMWPPNFAIFTKVWSETLVTIQLAFVSTIIAAVISLPFAFLGASNVMRTGFEKIILSITRFSLNANRAIDSLILAMFFVSAVGLGPFAGVMALAIHSVGMLGKLFFEAVEGVDKGPIEALEASGASRLQVLRWAIIPQVLPAFIGFSMYRFELNIRAAVVLGVVGAGGIGFLLTEYMRLFQSQNVAVVLLTILILVMSIDYVSNWARKKLF